jgi:hypothetical protein
MDDDLQNPPHEIIHLIHKMQEGYDVVFGKFKQKKHVLYRRIGTKIINVLNSQIFHKPQEITLSNFRIIKKDVIQRILQYNTGFPYIPGLILLFVDNVGNVLVEHHERKIGKSNYTLYRIFQLVARLLFNYSSFPLKLMSLAGLICCIMSLGICALVILKALLWGTNVPGWASIVALISLFNSFIMLMFGLTGEYLSRILSQLSYSQSYQIKEVLKHE